MKHKIVSAVVYGITALDFANFLGAGPVSPNSVWLVRIAALGAVLFVLACVLSLFKPRIGIICAVAACICSWPLFSGELLAILGVWRSLLSVIHYSYWGARVVSVYMLVIASIYSLSELRLLFRSSATV